MPRQKEASFDLTPMIDVILLLIIFFTFTAQFSSTQRTPMDLPRERGEEAPRASTEMVIDLDANGRVKVLGHEYDLETLATLLAGREFVVEGAGPDASGLAQPVEVVIRAHRDCTTANLNALAQVLLRAGVRKWSLATSAE